MFAHIVPVLRVVRLCLEQDTDRDLPSAARPPVVPPSSVQQRALVEKGKDRGSEGGEVVEQDNTEQVLAGGKPNIACYVIQHMVHPRFLS